MLASRVLFFVSVVLPSALPSAHAEGAAPVSEAGLGLIAYVGDTVILDGSGSSDPEGDPLTYTWSQVGGPPTELQGGDSAQPQFTVSAPGTLRYALVVNDGLTDSAADTVEVVVPFEQIEGVETGCSALPAAPSALLGLAALALVRRRAV
jgi:hypothetical protein